MILVCAATGTEAGACRRGLAAAGARDLEVLETGVGPERAASALGRRLAGGRPALVVSAGFAGALGDGVAPLDWITAASVHRLAGGRAEAVPLPAGLLRAAPGAIPCAVVSAPHVVPAAIEGLPAPAAADMESAALAEVAAAAGVPFAVLRLVTDTPSRPLPALARTLAAALGAPDAAARAAQGARAALEAARSPLAAAGLVRDGIAWQRALRDGWRERAAAVAALAR